MAKTLSDTQIRHFREEGWLAPLRAMDASQAADCAARIADYEVKMGESANRGPKIEGHQAMPWLIEDHHGHWNPEPLLRFDLDPVAYDAMRAAWGQYRDSEVRQAAEA